MNEEITLSSRRIYEGKVVNLRVDTVELEPGVESTREIVEHSESVAIVPVDGRNKVLLVRQYRKAVGETLLEIPAGGVKPGESPEQCVFRELREETGYTAGKIQHIGGIYASPGYCTEFLHLYLATHLTRAPLPMDPDEKIEVVRVPLRRIPDLIVAGEIQDSKSLAGLLSVICLPLTGTGNRG